MIGLRVTEILGAVEFTESDFLKEWVDFCTERRNLCSQNNDLIGKDFYKLLVNSVFGKFGENLGKKIMNLTFLKK